MRVKFSYVSIDVFLHLKKAQPSTQRLPHCVGTRNVSDYEEPILQEVGFKFLCLRDTIIHVASSNNFPFVVD